MKKLTLIVALFAVNSLFSQEKYNLPPGSVLKVKASIEDNYSYKLNFIDDASLVEKNLNFLASIPSDELEEMKILAPEKFEYYQKANDFYNSLSVKVKNTFSIQDIWNIYVFDQELKETIQNIK
jgi:hypothetical protein